jgi:hypothetical protein
MSHSLIHGVTHIDELKDKRYRAENPWACRPRIPFDRRFLSKRKRADVQEQAAKTGDGEDPCRLNVLRSIVGERATGSVGVRPDWLPAGVRISAIRLTGPGLRGSRRLQREIESLDG